MEHHAFVFDYDAFQSELVPLLKDALPLDNPEPLARFIDTHLDQLTLPQDGTPLDTSWRNSLPNSVGINEYGALALTRYYSPLDDVGLLAEWDDLWDFLEQYGLADIMLGTPLSRGLVGFYPSGDYSYLQSPEQVTDNLKRLEELYKDNHEIDNEIDELVTMFQRAARALKGLYITLQSA
jgi:hypothetical protein